MNTAPVFPVSVSGMMTPSMYAFGMPPTIPDEINLSPPTLTRQQAVGISSVMMPMGTPTKPTRSYAEMPPMAPWVSEKRMSRILGLSQEDIPTMPQFSPELTRKDAVVYEDPTDAQTVIESDWTQGLEQLNNLSNGILKSRETPCPFADVLATRLLALLTETVADQSPESVAVILFKYANAVRCISPQMEKTPEEREYGYAVVREYATYVSKLME